MSTRSQVSVTSLHVAAAARDAQADASASTGTRLSVIVPTYNEKANIAPMVASLDRALGSLQWEVVFVDDGSPDGTAEEVRAIARVDRRVRLISRHNRRGLASAVVEGGLAAVGEIVAVMDGDLQHDESVLPELYRRVASGEADIASASRFLEDHAREGLSSDQRLALSNRGISMANRFFGLQLTDPLTGFFALRRDKLEAAVPRLSGLGFKILLDLITSMDKPRVSEVPFRFRQRVAGESKLDRRVMYDFFLFFMEKWIGRFAPIPGTWLSTALIASLGILAHLALVIPAVSLFNLPFVPAQIAAAVLSVLVVFSANNWVSRSDAMLKGARFWQGLAVFCLMSAIGVAANVGVAALIHRDFPEMVYVLPATAGALVSVVWNFIAGKAFGFWNRRTRQSAAARSSQRAGRLSVVEGKEAHAAETTWMGDSPLGKHRHLIKYLAIGATASAIDVILFMVIYNLMNQPALVAHSISVPVSVIFSFVVNARHNFRTADHMVLRLLSFVVVCTIGYMSGFGVIELARQQGLDSNIGKIISLPVVFAIQYVLNSRITFHKASRAPA
jgi:dolichol-phosphate mannosyltransferase